MAKKKVKGICSDDQESWGNYEVTNKHREVFKKVATGEVCKYSLAQIMLRGVDSMTVEMCTLELFCREYKSFNKRERKALSFGYSVAQSVYWSTAKRKLLIDPRYGNNVKVALDMGGNKGEGEGERVLRITVRPKD